jgi:hypothetical protein
MRLPGFRVGGIRREANRVSRKLGPSSKRDLCWESGRYRARISTVSTRFPTTFNRQLPGQQRIAGLAPTVASSSRDGNQEPRSPSMSRPASLTPAARRRAVPTHSQASSVVIRQHGSNSASPTGPLATPLPPRFCNNSIPAVRGRSRRELRARVGRSLLLEETVSRGASHAPPCRLPSECDCPISIQPSGASEAHSVEGLIPELSAGFSCWIRDSAPGRKGSAGEGWGDGGDSFQPTACVAFIRPSTPAGSAHTPGQ